MIYIFHHNDLDGRCAAAVALRKLGDKGTKVVEVSYEKPIPYDTINGDDTAYVLDFSCQPSDDWKKLLARTKNVIWIDHHKSEIQLDGPQKKLPGLRRIDKSGAGLAWEYFFKDKPVPRAVELVSDFDTWTFKHGDETKHFVAGMEARDYSPRSPIWKKLLDDDKQLLTELKQQGVWIRKALLNKQQEVVRKLGYEVEFDGKKIFVVNSDGFNSEGFGDLIKKYPFVAKYSYDGEKWTVSMYTSRDDIDVGVIAKKHGGGGHKGSAGFQEKTNPFILKGKPMTKQQAYREINGIPVQPIDVARLVMAEHRRKAARVHIAKQANVVKFAQYWLRGRMKKQALSWDDLAKYKYELAGGGLGAGLGALGAYMSNRDALLGALLGGGAGAVGGHYLGQWANQPGQAQQAYNEEMDKALKAPKGKKKPVAEPPAPVAKKEKEEEAGIAPDLSTLRRIAPDKQTITTAEPKRTRKPAPSPVEARKQLTATPEYAGGFRYSQPRTADQRNALMAAKERRKEEEERARREANLRATQARLAAGYSKLPLTDLLSLYAYQNYMRPAGQWAGRQYEGVTGAAKGLYRGAANTASNAFYGVNRPGVRALHWLRNLPSTLRNRLARDVARQQVR